MVSLCEKGGIVLQVNINNMGITCLLTVIIHEVQQVWRMNAGFMKQSDPVIRYTLH
jgi:hypothetical protein